MKDSIPNFCEEVKLLNRYGSKGFFLGIHIKFNGPEQLFSTYPEEWQTYYTDNNLLTFDPVFLWAVSNLGTKRWSDIKLPDIKGVMHKARKFGMNYGVVLTCKVGRKKSILTLSRRDREFLDEELEILEGIFNRLVELASQKYMLSEDEIKALSLLATGLQFKDIAVRLGISTSSAKNRLQSAKLKLNAQSSHHAVFIAAKEDII